MAFEQDVRIGDQSARLEALLQSLAEALVDDISAVSVTTLFLEEKTIRLSLSVANADLGRVIGQQGRAARCLRIILSGAATKLGLQSQIVFLDKAG